MSPAIAMTTTHKAHVVDSQVVLQKGVKHLYETGVTKVPEKYILPIQDRPNNTPKENIKSNNNNQNLKLPVIDFAELMQSSTRATVLESLSNACEQYGFFQLVNHGIPGEVIDKMIEVSTRFFELPFEERSKYMSSDMKSPVRYGTSFNQTKDKVFCWRDFLKLVCNPMPEVLPHWPSNPVDFRNLAARYANETKYLFLMIMEAIVESLGINTSTTTTCVGATDKKTQEEIERDNTTTHATTNSNDNHDYDGDNLMEKFEDGSQLMVVNCYPPCPQPDLTLGMPPHSDYGFLTLLLQDEVEGLQIQFQDTWVTVDPIPGSFVVNVGDHLEIFSNGKYKSVLHRVLVNSLRARTSVASLHSLPFDCTVSPCPSLIDEANPRRYKDTDFASFLEYISSREPKRKNFLETRKLT